MMNVWEVWPDANRYLCVQPSDLRYFQARFDGKPLAGHWRAPEFELLNRSKKVADSTSWQIGSRSFLVSSRVAGLLQPLVGTRVEFLPFATIKGTELLAVNVCEQVPVVDWHRSVCSTPSKVESIILLPPPSKLPLLFKDPELPSYTFASDALGQLAVANGWTGLRLAEPQKDRLRQIVTGNQINQFQGL